MPASGITKKTGYSYEGKPITLEKKRGPTPEDGYPRRKSGWYTEETRLRAATLWAVCRNDTQAAELARVPVGRIKAWKNEAWWRNVVDQVVKEKNDELDAALTGIIHKASDLMAERLENGDIKINFKTGEIIRAPADLKSLQYVIGIIFDKRQLLRGEATSRTESVSSSQKLEELKEAFTRFSKATEIEGIRDEQEEPRSPDEGEDAGRQGQEALLIEGTVSTEPTTDSGLFGDALVGDDGVVSPETGLQSQDDRVESLREPEGTEESLHA